MFDITSVLKDVSGPDTGKEQIEYIQLDKIDPDENNFYSLDGLYELAANIELIGLQQPLRVRPGSEPGRYTIVSGHRRRAALRKIAERAEDYPASMSRPVLCLVEPEGTEDDAEIRKLLEELKLLFANSDRTDMTVLTDNTASLTTDVTDGTLNFGVMLVDYQSNDCKFDHFTLEFLGDETRLSIDEPRHATDARNLIYDITGRRRVHLQKGLNIVDGKKILMK